MVRTPTNGLRDWSPVLPIRSMGLQGGFHTGFTLSPSPSIYIVMKKLPQKGRFFPPFLLINLKPAATQKKNHGFEDPFLGSRKCPTRRKTDRGYLGVALDRLAQIHTHYFGGGFEKTVGHLDWIDRLDDSKTTACLHVYEGNETYKVEWQTWNLRIFIYTLSRFFFCGNFFLPPFGQLSWFGHASEMVS